MGHDHSADVTFIIREVRKRFHAALSGVPGLHSVLPVGSLAGPRAPSSRRHARTWDLDYIALLEQLDSSTPQALANMLDQICSQATTERVEVTYRLVNAPYKPEPRKPTSILLHVLLHDATTFFKKQSKLFLFSWRDAKPIYGPDSFGANYDGKPPSIESLLHDDYGVIHSQKIIEQLPRELLRGWNRAALPTSVTNWEVLLSDAQQQDLAAYLVTWAACNTLRVLSGQHLEYDLTTMNRFAEEFQFLGRGTAALPRMLFQSRYHHEPSYQPAPELRSYAAEFLSELRVWLVAGMPRSDAIVLRNSLLETRDRDLRYLADIADRLHRIGRQEEPHRLILRDASLAHAFGIDLDQRALDHLAGVLDCAAQFSATLGRILDRRAYYYLAKMLEVLTRTYVHPPALATVERLCVGTRYSLGLDLIEASKRARDESDLMNLIETTVDPRLFCALRVWEMRRDFGYSCPDWLVRATCNYLLDLFDEQNVRVDDESNVWWALHLLFDANRDRPDVLPASSQAKLHRLLSFMLEREGELLVAPHATTREVTPELRVRSRTVLYSIQNAVLLGTVVPQHQRALLVRARSWWQEVAEVPELNAYLCALRAQTATVFVREIEKINAEAGGRPSSFQTGREEMTSTAQDKDVSGAAVFLDLRGAVVGAIAIGDNHDINLQLPLTRIVEQSKTIEQSGAADVAEALRELAVAVAGRGSSLREEEKHAALKQLLELSGEAMNPAPKRGKERIKKVLRGLNKLLATTANLAEIWSAWAPALKSHFGPW